MSDPFDSPADRWGLIFYGSGLYRRAHTRQEWAQIAEATRTADLVHHKGIRGDDAWCTIAVDTFTRLDHAGAYRDLEHGDTPRWHADEHLIRAWLGAPIIPAHARQDTILTASGWQHALHPRRRVDPADLTLLVDLAQDAGVVGEPQHEVSLLRWVRDGGFRDDSFLVLVWRPGGPALASGPVPLAQLIGAGGSATDRAVALLSGVATVANRLLAAAAPDPAPAADMSQVLFAVHEQPLRHGGHAFRLITGTADADPPALPSPPPPPRPPRHPRT
jgi:hypothetical protein